MAGQINTGDDALASDFINESERDATPANDEGRVAKLESDGRIGAFFTRIGLTINAGETINGATLPVPVYQDKSDGELYACDANDTGKLKFIGFAISNSTNGNPIKFQGAGVVSGFSGLSFGEKYYVQDSVGTIGTTPGTYEVLVGIAVSSTQILIQKGGRYASGVTSFNSTSNQTITTGFRPSRINIYGTVVVSANKISFSQGGWTLNGGNNCVYYGTDGGSDFAGGTNNTAWHLHDGDNVRHSGNVDTITDTSFRLSNSEVTDNVTAYLYWEAEGDF